MKFCIKLKVIFLIMAVALSSKLLRVTSVKARMETMQRILRRISCSPYVANDILYIGTDDLYFYALDATTGSTLWSKQVLNNSASASVSDGIVYIGGGGTHNFYALDAVTVAEKWRFPIQNGLMTSSPLVVDESGAPHHPGDSGVQS